MKEQLVSFETAKLAKEKGFDLETSKFYLSDKTLITAFEDSKGNEAEYYFDADSFLENWNRKGWLVTKECNMGFGVTEGKNGYMQGFSAPTQSLLQKWLREKYKIHLVIIPTVEGYFTYKLLDIHCDPENKIETSPYSDVCSTDFDTYEQALEAGMQKALMAINADKKD